MRNIHLLLIEDHRADAVLVQELLREDLSRHYRLTHAESLAAAEKHLAADRFDVALVDLGLPDAVGRETFDRVKALAPDLPLVIHTGLADEDLAIELVGQGAQDYLVKGEGDSRLLSRTIRYSIERRQALDTIREKEEQYHLLFSAETDGILICDRQSGRIQEINPAGLELYGLSSNDLGTLRLADLQSQIHPLPLLGEANPPLTGGERLEYHRRRDGTLFPAAVSIGNFQLREQSLQGVIVRDMTEQVNAQRLKEEMLQAISHEMRTPLTALLGYTEMLLDNPPSQQQLAIQVRTMHGECLRLAELVENQLELVGFLSGKVVLERQAIDPCKLFQAALHKFIPTQQSHRVEIDCPANLPAVQGDFRLLQMALENLISNALKYSPEDDRIELRAQATPAQITLCVTDQGEGISSEICEQMFNAFFRLRHWDSRCLGGTTLGLPLVKAIALAHGGSVWVEPAAPRGSRFCLTLPCSNQSPDHLRGTANGI